ncbi:MAG: penicillin-binding transpeptidase domain-containing protein, partial [Proteobacteria bacterium]|nr:penicillin-binding transpeptidase domain-containing protein [Pseudomonadota bacterium]
MIASTLAVLCLRLWHLQIVKGDYYTKISANNYTRMIEITAPRGLIYDRHGELILGNRPFYDLVIVPQFVQNFDHTISNLSRLLSLSKRSLAKITSNQQPKFLPITLKKNLTLHEIALIESQKMQLPGVHITKNIRRDYSSHPPPHLVGYLSSPSAKQLNELQQKHPHKMYRSSDQVGKFGLEKVWEGELKGKKGKQILQVDAFGRRVDDPLVTWSLPKIPAISGHHLILSLDRSLQKIAEKAFTGKDGAVVVVDARDGGILAMVSHPSYPSNLYQSPISKHEWNNILHHPAKPLFDKTTGAEYPPGSTFKVILALAGLQEAVIDRHSEKHCTGSIRLGKKVFHCHKRSGHGVVNLKRAIAQSCNVFFYELGL